MKKKLLALVIVGLLFTSGTITEQNANGGCWVTNNSPDGVCIDNRCITTGSGSGCKIRISQVLTKIFE